MLDRDDFVALQQHSGFMQHHTDQCMYGGESQKLTTLFAFGIDFIPTETRCDHPPEWHWITTASGESKWVLSAHPPIAGCKAADGEWATKAAEQYPTAFNKELAKRISAAAWRIFKARQKKGPPAPAAKLSVPTATPPTTAGSETTRVLE